MLFFTIYLRYRAKGALMNKRKRIRIDYPSRKAIKRANLTWNYITNLTQSIKKEGIK